MTSLNPLWIQALTYSARLDRQSTKASWTEGVIEGLATTQRAAGTNMSVDVSVGRDIIYGDDQTDQGAYLDTVTVFENVVIAAAPGANSRRDLVYRRINDPNAGGPAGSTATFGVVTGTAGASPALPALPTSAIPLAEVLVASGTVAITNAMITDLRYPSWQIGGCPPGTPIPWFGTEALIPANALLLNGQSVLKSTWWRIFKFYGTTFGSTTTNFSVPDLRGRALFGLDNMGGADGGRLTMANTLGGTGGEELHTLSVAETPVKSHLHALTHDHGITGGLVYSTGAIGDSGVADQPGPTGVTRTIATIAAGTTTRTPLSTQIDEVNFVGNTSATSDGTATPFTNMPPYLLCNWIALG